MYKLAQKIFYEQLFQRYSRALHHRYQQSGDNPLYYILKGIFLKLKYPEELIDSAINRLHHPTDPVQTPANSPVRITLPFKNQKSADVVRRRLGDLGTKINQQLQPVFTSKKIADHLKVTEEKPPLINQQSVVYEFTCDLCDTNYIGQVHLPPSPSTRRGT